MEEKDQEVDCEEDQEASPKNPSPSLLRFDLLFFYASDFGCFHAWTTAFSEVMEAETPDFHRRAITRNLGRKHLAPNEVRFIEALSRPRTPVYLKS